VVSNTRDEAARDIGPPSPLGQAAPDAEIAEQAELPPDLAGQGLIEPLDLETPGLDASAFDEPEEEEEFEPSADGGDGDFGGSDDGDDSGDGGLVPAGGGPVGEPRARPGSRLIGFLLGSWRELQRVQWPDRRQVMQATGVVIGFVIVAGLFLGAADLVSGKLINLILYGHT
jgi:preprotein translocase subunit SecE